MAFEEDDARGQPKARARRKTIICMARKLILDRDEGECRERILDRNEGECLCRNEGECNEGECLCRNEGECVVLF